MHQINRRVAIATGIAATSDAFAVETRGLNFPVDHGAHPEFKHEQWQLAGIARSRENTFGFQFSVNRTARDGMQHWIACASLTDTKSARFWLDHRSETKKTQSTSSGTLSISDWKWTRSAGGYQVSMSTDTFGLTLSVATRQSVLLHGEGGALQLDQNEAALKRLYTLPHCRVTGHLSVAGKHLTVDGDGFLSHQWDNLKPEFIAAGFDGFAMNLFDGSFVAAYQTRDQNGHRLWDGGVLRTAKGQRFRFRQGTVVFSRQKVWRSPMSRGNYPVEWMVQTPADFYTVRATIPHQEVDNRPANASVYWQGLSDLFDSNGSRIGQGYLEMSGYAQAKSI